MALTLPRGPLGTKRTGLFSVPVPFGLAYVEPHPFRVQAWLGGQLVIDTEQALLVHRPGEPNVYAFRPEDVGDLPQEPEQVATGYVCVPWEAVDEWIEEGRRLVDYPPNPYHRVDCRPTSRHLRVDVAGTTLVDTEETVLLVETALRPRLYVDPAYVRTDLLRPTATTSYCNYKGVASYWSAVIGDTVVEDVAWSYEEPHDESLAIRGFLSFDGARVDMTAAVPGPSRMTPA